jgi:hypothetical protein
MRYAQRLVLFGHEILPWRKLWSPPKAQTVPGRKRIRDALWAIIEDDPDKNYELLLTESRVPHASLVRFLRDEDDGALSEAQTVACVRFCSAFGHNTETGKLIRPSGLALERPEPAPPKPPQPLRPADEIIAETRLRRLAKLNPHWR